MKLPLSWIKEFINPELSIEEISHVLTMAGLEVDSIENAPLPYTQVIVSKVLSTKPHPEADRLCIATVFDGSVENQVVCGAPNCRKGLVTAYAKVGAKLDLNSDKPFKIKKSKIRGVESMGMLCSEQELDLSEEAEGIIELPSDLAPGTSLEALYGDHILEISLTPNLGHCSSVLGVARELFAATEAPIHLPKIEPKENPHDCIEDSVRIFVQNSEHCPRYACRLIKGVKIAPSPAHLRQRLERCGLRSVNNVVDITNLVLLEFGHPLHAFDFDKLSGQQIIVRDAQKQEKFQTLDGQIHSLNKEALLICDKEKPVALAGVMGGLNSEVSTTTQNILLESAYFQANNIRRTSKSLSLSTDASKRFERGTDPNNALIALDRAASLICEFAGGSCSKGIIDVHSSDFKRWKISCRHSRINALLGTQLSSDEVQSIFQKLDLKSSYDGKDTFSVEIPTYRNDLQREVDLIEEVVRVYGYNNVEIKAARYQTSTLPHTPLFSFERTVRSRSLAEGLQELLTCDLISPSQLKTILGKTVAPQAVVKVLNPTSVEQSILRPSLLPGLLQVVKHNLDHKNPSIHGFEIGKIHFKNEEQYAEQSTLALVSTGQSTPHHWSEKPEETDFFTLKGSLENQLSALNIQNYSFTPSDITNLHPGRQARIYIGEREAGYLGEVHPATLRKLGIHQRVFFAELSLHSLFISQKTDKKLKEIPIFPGSERDWTLPLKEGTPVDDLFAAIRQCQSKFLQEVTLLDIYRGQTTDPGAKNVTLRFFYQDKKKTISLKTVDLEHTRITEKVQTLLEGNKHQAGNIVF